MTRLKVVGFASGSPLSQEAMACIARNHRLAAVVTPRPQRSLMQRLRRTLGRIHDPLARLGAPVVPISEVEHIRPDLIVVASFPGILSAATLAAAGIGALNVHMSLLPRHRGIDPIFWTYWDDDRDAGVTIHWMNERIDAGNIAAQESLLLKRGLPSRELYVRLVSCGVKLLSEILGCVASGTILSRPQDEERATYESAADIARAQIPFEQWPAERVWHVLSGLGDQRSGLVMDASGRPLLHARATLYRIASDVRPGCIVAGVAGYELHCRDGVVAVGRRS
jgi:methionyl-tRNA formyltransferase